MSLIHVEQMVRLLIADTRLKATALSPEDRHRDEFLLALREQLHDDVLSLLTPEEHILEQVGEVEPEPWQVGGRAALAYVQRRLAHAAQSVDAKAVICLFGGAPLRSPIPVFSYQHCRPHTPRASVMKRLALAAGQAGVGGSSGRVAMTDLPEPGTGDLIRLEPWLDSRFSPDAGAADAEILFGLDLEPGYALAYGISRTELDLLVAAWSWVAGSMGDAYPLVILGLDPMGSAYVLDKARKLALESTLTLRNTTELATLAAIYRGASLFIHGEVWGTGQALRWALATGLPIAALENPRSVTIVGDAAYLVPPREGRTWGAAILSILVQDDLAAQLRERALSRAARYRRENPLAPFIQALRSIPG